MNKRDFLFRNQQKMDRLNVIWILGESIRNYPGNDRFSRYKIIDKIAPEGIIFNNLIVSAPSTIMSQSSMLTGQPTTYLNRTYANIEFTDCPFFSLSKILKEKGYNIYTTTHYIEGRKLFRELLHPLNKKNLPKKIKNDMSWSSEDINQVLDHLLEKRLKEPFFLLLNYNNQDSTERLIELAIEKMKKKGAYERSIFLFCPDHGCPDIDRNGPHERHGMVLTDANILIPFFIEWPCCPKKIVDKLVSSLDILPTILNILEISSQKYNLKGNSLLPLITSKGEYTKTKFRVDTRFIFQRGRTVCIYDKKLKYIIYLDKPSGKNEEFFDLSNDPDEKNNLIQSKKYNTEIQEFRREFEKTEEELVNFHLKYLAEKFKKRLQSFLNQDQSDISKKIFLLGSAHPLFIKAILKTINVFFPEYKVDLAIAPGLVEKKKYADRVNFHYLGVKQKDYEYTMPDYNEENNPLFSKYSYKIPIRYHSILHDGFKQKHSALCNKDYDLVIVPLDNPYGVGHKELIKIVKELKTKKIIYVDYNMDFKKPTNWFIKGLCLINTKKKYYLTNPKMLFYEVKRYYLEEVRNR